MRIVWLSANSFGLHLLKEAVNIPEVDIVGIITLADDAKTVMYDGVPKAEWSKFSIPVHEISMIKEEEELIKSLNPDIIIMCGWRQLIPQNIINIPKEGFIGFHPTLLPIGRGPAPIINSILHGFNESGLSMFYVAEGLDDGDIIGQEAFSIEDSDYAADVYTKVELAGKTLIQKYLPLLIKGKAPRIPQDNTKATIFEKPKLKNNEIDLENESVEEIHRKIRALSKPYNGAYLKKDGKKIVILKADMVDVK